MVRDRKRTPIASFLVFISVAGLFGMIACKRQAGDTRAVDVQAIEATDAEWSKAALAHDLDRTVAYYTDDAVLLAPNEPIAKDKQTIRASWALLLSPNNTVSWQPTRVDVAQSGELAYVVGTYKLNIKDAKGKVTTDRGKVMEVFKKQADGTWKAVADMYNSDLPAPSA